MTAQELLDFLVSIPEKQRKVLEIYNRTGCVGGIPSMESVYKTSLSTYGFNHCTIPCILLENSKWFPEEKIENES